MTESPLPWLDIADEVARSRQRAGYKGVAVLGTQFIMEREMYRSSLGRYGIESRIPEASDGLWLNRVIFDEIVEGSFLDAQSGESSIFSSQK